MAEQVLKEKFPEVDTVVSRTGRAEIATDPMGVEISDTYIMLKPPDTWRFSSKEELIEAIDRAMKREVPGAIFSYSQPIELRVEELISGVRSSVGIHIYGDDLKKLKEVADDVARVVGQVPGAADVKAEQTQGLPMLRVQIDRQAIARYGINATRVLDVIETVGGKRVGTVLEGQKRFVLQARFDQSVRDNLDAIRNLRIGVPSSDGTTMQIPITQLAKVTIEDGPAQISRDRISRRINVEANVRGRDLASFVVDARAAVDTQMKLPAGWTIEWGGQFENLQAASKRLAVLIPVAAATDFCLASLDVPFVETRAAYLPQRAHGDYRWTYCPCYSRLPVFHFRRGGVHCPLRGGGPKRRGVGLVHRPAAQRRRLRARRC